MESGSYVQPRPRFESSPLLNLFKLAGCRRFNACGSHIHSTDNRNFQINVIHLFTQEISHRKSDTVGLTTTSWSVDLPFLNFARFSLFFVFSSPLLSSLSLSLPFASLPYKPSGLPHTATCPRARLPSAMASPSSSPGGSHDGSSKHSFALLISTFSSRTIYYRTMLILVLIQLSGGMLNSMWSLALIFFAILIHFFYCTLVFVAI